VQPGDLVRITRASIGVPKNTIGLIVKARDTQVDEHDPRPFPVCHVQLLNGAVLRYLTQDLRKVR
jgi:hypothetical protein